MLELNSLPHHTETIKSRRGYNLFIRFNGDPANGRPLAIVAHGLSDVHDSAPLRAMAIGLIEAGYNVIAYDGTNSWGRSGGNLAEATLTGAYEDLIDVVKWAMTQPGYTEPLVLAGHSMGGAAALRFAYDQPRLVSRLVLVAPVVAGELLADRLPKLVREVWRLVDRLPEPGHRKKVYRYNLLRDGLSYNGPQLAAGITVPVTIIGGEKDRIIRMRDLRELQQSFSQTKAKLIELKEANHGFTGIEAELARAIKQSM